MMRISSAARRFAKIQPCQMKFMATLVATEEFPIPASLTPKAVKADVITASTLANGVKIISKDTANSALVSIKVVVSGGSGYESVSEKGSAHMLSVAAFSGHTKKSGLRLMRDLENMGASVSSSADREKITFSLSVMKENVTEAFHTFAEAICSPPTGAHVIKERIPAAQIAYDEKASSPQLMLSEMLHESMYGETSPLGASLFASKLEKLSYSDMIGYKSKIFKSGNTSVVASGLSHTSLQALVEGSLSLSSGVVDAPECPYVGGETKIRADLGTTHAALAFPVSGADADKVSAVIACVLKARLAAASANGYTASAFSSSYTSTSATGVYVCDHPTRIGANLQLAANELRAIAKGDAAAQVELAKSQLGLVAAMGLEGDATDALVTAALSGKTVAAIVDYSSVDAKQVASAAAAMLSATPSYALLGVTAGAPTYATVSSLAKAPGVVPAL
mmetsp:Transcript_11659/g.11691  ORF Transcript_11659/g.11691 Transcript_11659/m.11691 type:complete len:451 (+) Transcript_11659:84-1436(+)|eukprot:CAMPEP_0182416304 /NCGR_PEP_ID=MMETSP1167-20130531/573_1 /TAXON_ID=2988 /ORGANISM="Mallomonas Sp, Strain CCMP3275" /LENGTH=450 /DNA_ID=CAMNT_0024588951 /DNA_START=70 /DNA_END=1422 /DNA_ORIENTATION=+